MDQFIQHITSLYEQHIVLTNKQPQLIILLTFLITFLLIRVITHKIRTGQGRVLRNLSVGGTHIHHLVWGIILLLITGYISVAFELSRLRNLLALSFGVGAALTLDEFAVWLNLKDVYWTKEGRKSINAVISMAALLALILVGQSFWWELGYEVLRLLNIF